MGPVRWCLSHFRPDRPAASDGRRAVYMDFQAGSREPGGGWSWVLGQLPPSRWIDRRGGCGRCGGGVLGRGWVVISDMIGTPPSGPGVWVLHVSVVTPRGLS